MLRRSALVSKEADNLVYPTRRYRGSDRQPERNNARNERQKVGHSGANRSWEKSSFCRNAQWLDTLFFYEGCL